MRLPFKWIKITNTLSGSGVEATFRLPAGGLSAVAALATV
jgi:hypothetical protein